MLAESRTLALLAIVVALAMQQQQQQQVAAADQQVQDLSKLEWWKKTNFYHIYIRSFKDTNGTGEGDLRGVVSELDYLKSIGVETLLLSPFYSSPMKDAGYDIDDYLDVNYRFGSMREFESLVAGLKERGMRLLVDFVPNHTSNKHRWFQCSERALIDPECAKYKDYYVWSNSTRFEGKVPTNWISVFGGGTVWQWSDIRKEFYLHQFLPEQPDLNWKCEAVREEFREIARFWLRKGADGLRIDASPFLMEDLDEWRDEPENPDYKADAGHDPADRLLHIYTRHMPASAKLMKDWWEVAREPEFGGDRVVITEAYGSIPQLLECYGPSPADRYSDMPFNFELFYLSTGNFTPQSLRGALGNWLTSVRDLQWPDERGGRSPWTIWVTGNHDNKRVVNRVGSANAELYKWLAHFAPGVPVNYYGDEIGMHDANFNKIPKRTLDEGEPTRLIFRAPMAWTPEEPAAGFSSKGDTWMPLNENFRTNNVRSMLKEAREGRKNPLANFMRMQQVRRDHLAVIAFGDVVFYPNKQGSQSTVFSMGRTHPRFGNLLLVANLNPELSEQVALQTGTSLWQGQRLEPPKRAKLLMYNYADASQSLVEGATWIQLQNYPLKPHQALLLHWD